MQKTLTEYRTTLHNATLHSTSHIISNIIYYCVNCVLDINDADANRFETRMFRKKIRVVLKPVPGTANMLICPRCGSPHFTSDFYHGRSQHHKRL